MFDAFRSKNRALANDLKGEDAVCFLSRGENQVLFVYGFSGEENEVLGSARLRLRSGRWNPMMLANYAASVGLTLVGIKKFEEAYAEAHHIKEKGK